MLGCTIHAGPPTAPHPPIPSVIVREGNELSWEGLRDKEFRTPQVQEEGLTQLTNDLARPACPGSVYKARHSPGPPTCWPMPSISDLLGIPVMLEMMPPTLGQRTEPLESHRLGLKALFLCDFRQVTSLQSLQLLFLLMVKII